MLAALRRKCLSTSRHSFAYSTRSHFSPSFDPYTYTHGRWLDRDEERHEARKLHFDFQALLDLAVKCSPGARRVTDCRKKEGGFNRVFMIELDNGKTVVARLPTRIAGPASLAVGSEVATLQFVKDKTKLPVPNVLSWSSERDNVIGTEYIIMDEMPGVQLKDVWNSMTASQHIRCIQSLGHQLVQLWQLTFPSYGSLYLNDASPPGAVRLDDVYSIGPLCTAHIWDSKSLNTRESAVSAGHVGPWHSLEAYLLGLLSHARTAAPSNDEQTHDNELMYSEEARKTLLEIARDSLEALSTSDIVKDASGPTLFHPDLHTRNIFVDVEDPTKITGIIDWQSSAIEPAFMLAAETPDFAQEIPDDHDSPATSSTKTDELSPQAKARADAEYCAKVWSIMLHICPKSRNANDLDSSLVRFLAAGSAGWLKDPVAVRQMLLELRDKWDELCLPGRSFYQPTEDEMKDLERQLDLLKTQNRLREHLARLLGCQTDGWVPIEKWDEVLPIYRQEYRRFVDSILQESGADGTAAAAHSEADRLWPFDQR